MYKWGSKTIFYTFLGFYLLMKTNYISTKIKKKILHDSLKQKITSKKICGERGRNKDNASIHLHV